MGFWGGVRHTARWLVDATCNQRDNYSYIYHCRRKVRETVETVDHEEVGGRIEPERRFEKRLSRYLEVKGLVFLVRRERSHASDSKYALLLI